VAPLLLISESLHDSGRGCIPAQSLGSQSGLVIDDFTMTKPAGWQPNPGARLLTLNQCFQSNYTETFIEARRPAHWAITGVQCSARAGPPAWTTLTGPDLIALIEAACLDMNMLRY